MLVDNVMKNKTEVGSDRAGGRGLIEIDWLGYYTCHLSSLREKEIMNSYHGYLKFCAMVERILQCFLHVYGPPIFPQVPPILDYFLRLEYSKYVLNS